MNLTWFIGKIICYAIAFLLVVWTASKNDEDATLSYVFAFALASPAILADIYSFGRHRGWWQDSGLEGKSIPDEPDTFDSLLRVDGGLSLSSLQFPPPKYWQDFEQLCADLWQSIWKDPNVQRIGRQEQSQNGVDIIGRPQGTTDWVGIKCKVKDGLTKQTLSPTILNSEVENARSCDPPLSQFILATTAPRDQKIQSLAREITGKGLPVYVFGWDDICEKFDDHPEVCIKYYSRLLRQPSTHSTEVSVSSSSELTKHADFSLGRTASQAIVRSDSPIWENSSASISVESVHEGGAYSAILRYARELVESNSPRAAIDYLELNKDEIWGELSDGNKAKFFNCLGTAWVQLESEKEAASNFFLARKYDQADEKIACNCVIAYLLLEQYPEANSLAQELVRENPASEHARVALIHASKDSSFDSLVNSIPENFKHSPRISLAIGGEALERGLSDESIRWIRKSMDSEETPTWNAKRLLSFAISKKLSESQSMLLKTGHPTDEERKLLLEAETLLDAVLDPLKEVDARRANSSCLVNRAVTRRILGNSSGAIQDLDEALSYDNACAFANFQRALLAEDASDIDLALQCLDNTSDLNEFPATPVYKVFLVKKKSGAQAAAEEAGKVQELITSDDVKHEILSIVISALIDEGLIEQAETQAVALRSKHSEDSTDLVHNFEILVAQERFEEAEKMLDQAYSSITTSSKLSDIMSVADAVFRRNRFQEAAVLYERIADKRSNNFINRRLLQSYYRSSPLKKSLALARSIREVNGPLDFVTEIEVFLLQEIGAIQEAKEVCQQYVDKYPDAHDMVVRLAVIYLHADEPEKAEEILSNPPDASDVSVDTGIRIADLLIYRSRIKEAGKWLYELRRVNLSDFSIHMRYVQFVLVDSNAEPCFAAENEARIDTAVEIEDQSGDTFACIIDDRSDADMSKGEFRRSESICQRILGKQVGDQVAVNSGSRAGNKGTIVRISSKFEFAFHQSAALLERFKDDSGFIRLGASGENNDPKATIDAALDMIKEASEFQHGVVELYDAKKITLGALANIIGVNLVDLWSGLSNDSSQAIHCCEGVAEQMKFAERIVDLPDRKLIFDVVALLGIHSIGIQNELVSAYGRPGVSQATVDLVRSVIRERELRCKGGLESIVHVDGQFVRRSMTQEEVQESIDQLTALLDWIDSNCDILSVDQALELTFEYYTSLQQHLGKDQIDTVLLSKVPGRILLSDDLLLRVLAAHEFGVKGAWTQVLLRHLSAKRPGLKSRCERATISLIQLGYRHVAVDADLIIAAAELANWKMSEPFSSVIARIGSDECDQQSAIGVASQFFKRLWQEQAHEGEQELVAAVLDSISTGRNPKDITVRLSHALVKQMGYGIPANHFIHLISTWLESKPRDT